MPELYNWSLRKRHDSSEIYLHGNVVDSPKFPDSMPINTSNIVTLNIDEQGVFQFQTVHTLYTCRAENFDFSRFSNLPNIQTDAYKSMIDIVSDLLSKHENKSETFRLHNEVLIELGNTAEYYFKRAVININGETSIEENVYPHIGMLQDSCILDVCVNGETIDLRYFPYEDCKLQFYCEDMPEYVSLIFKNIGTKPMKIGTSAGAYEIKPLEVINTSKVKPNSTDKSVYGRDLYGLQDMSQI